MKKEEYKEQVEFLKKKIKLGFRGNDLYTLFNKKFKLAIATYERRVAMARAQMAGVTKGPACWVLVNVSPDGKDHQKPTIKNNENSYHQNEADMYHQDTTEEPLKSTINKRDAKDHQNSGKNCHQNGGDTYHQKKVVRASAVSAAQEVTAAAENLLCMEVLSVEECLLMLSRFAMGQYVRARHFSCGGEVVEVQETPPFTARRSAVMAILKYHEALAGDKSFKGELGYDPKKYVPMSTDELLNLTKEKRWEILQNFQRLNNK
jgi:hypothetical protein